MEEKRLWLLIWSAITVGPVSYLMRQITRWRVKKDKQM